MRHTTLRQTITAAAGGLAWLLMLGVVGGMDLGSIPVGTGIICSFSLLAAGTTALWKAGWLR